MGQNGYIKLDLIVQAPLCPNGFPIQLFLCHTFESALNSRLPQSFRLKTLFTHFLTKKCGLRHDFSSAERILALEYDFSIKSLINL